MIDRQGRTHRFFFLANTDESVASNGPSSSAATGGEGGSLAHIQCAYACCERAGRRASDQSTDR